jgi:hypothetical protein
MTKFEAGLILQTLDNSNEYKILVVWPEQNDNYEDYEVGWKWIKSIHGRSCGCALGRDHWGVLVSM